MKKISFILILLILCVTLIACFGSGKTDESDTTASEDASESVDVSESESRVSEIPVELFTVEIKQETIEGDVYTANMIYPQVSGYSDTEIEEKVNALIHSYATNKRNTAIAQTGAESGVYYDIDSFNVTYKSDKLISALCRGTVSVDGSSYVTNFAYGINIDFAGAKLIGFDGIVDYKNFEKDFIGGAYIQTRGYENLLEETNFSDIISQYDDLYSIYPEFYIRQSDNGVVLGVIADTIQVLGNVAEFETVVSGKNYMTKYFSEIIM